MWHRGGNIWNDGAPDRGARLVRKSNYALRLQPSLMEELRKVAAEDQTTINQLINVAVAEKLAVMRARRWFEERAARGDPKKALEILARVGRGQPPLPGDLLFRAIQTHAMRDWDTPEDDEAFGDL
jgi:hypothetical protein